MPTNVDHDLYQYSQEGLVSCMMYDPSLYDEAMGILEPDSFDVPQLKAVFTAMVAVHKGEVPETGTLGVASALSREGLLGDNGVSLQFLMDLQARGEKSLLIAPMATWASIVTSYVTKQKAREAVIKATKELQDGAGGDVQEVVSELVADLNETMASMASDSTVSDMSDMASEYMEKIDEREKRRKENENGASGLQGIPTPLPSLNEWTTGMLPGEVYVLGAQTSIGKSAMAVDFIVSAASAGNSVLMFSLEMNREELEDRLVANVSGVPMNFLKQGDLRGDQRGKVERALAEYSKMSVHLDVGTDLSVDVMRSKATKMARSSVGLDFIIVDYLQLAKPSGGNNRQEQVAEMSRAVKLMAKDLGVPILVLVQLVRPSKDAISQKPSLYGIRESGAIANDASVIILLHRDKSEGETINKTLALIEKNRNGPRDKEILLHSNLACSSFREVTESEKLELDQQAMDDLTQDFDSDDEEEF